MQYALEIRCELRTRQHLKQLAHNTCDRVIDGYAPDRLTFLVQLSGNVDLCKFAVPADELGFRDFGKIVVLCRHPKYRHGFRLPLRQTTCEFNGGERFINRIQWPSK